MQRLKARIGTRALRELGSGRCARGFHWVIIHTPASLLSRQGTLAYPIGQQSTDSVSIRGGGGASQCIVYSYGIILMFVGGLLIHQKRRCFEFSAVLLRMSSTITATIGFHNKTRLIKYCNQVPIHSQITMELIISPACRL